MPRGVKTSLALQESILNVLCSNLHICEFTVRFIYIKLTTWDKLSDELILDKLRGWEANCGGIEMMKCRAFQARDLPQA